MLFDRLFNLAIIRDHHYCTKFIDNQSVVLDFGSYVGDFSREINLKHNCFCYAVEASPENYHKININEKIKKFNYAISSYDGKIDFNLSANPEANTIFQKCASESTIQVPTISFESFLATNNIDKLSLLKLDIEGAEVQLFSSTSSETLMHIDQISIEFHDFITSFNMEEEVNSVIKRLQKNGFYYINFSRLYHYDVLFLNSKVFSYLDYYKIKYFARFFEVLKRRSLKVIKFIGA